MLNHVSSAAACCSALGAGESMGIKRTRPHGPSATWQLFLYGAMCAGCAPGPFRAKLQCVQSTAKTGYQFPRQYCATCMHQVCWRPVNSLRPQESIAVSSRESAARSYHNLQFKLNAALPHMAVLSALCDVRRICAGQNSQHCVISTFSYPSRSQSLLFHTPLTHNLCFFIPLSLIISTFSYPSSS